MRRHDGFTLIELAVVVAISAVILGAVLQLVTTQIENSRTVTMRAKLDAIRSALTTFVGRNNRLPCPAIETLPTGNIAYGLEAPTPGACTGATVVGSAVRGTLPFRSLGLSEDDSLDVYLSRFTYVVSLTATALTDLTVAGAQGSITLHSAEPPAKGLAPAGNQINACSIDPTDNGCNSQAIVIVLSHGPNAYGAFQRSAERTPFPDDEPSPLELANADADDAFIVHTFSDVAPIYDDQILALTPDTLLAPLVRDGAIRSARSVTIEQMQAARDAILTAIVNSGGAIPASIPAFKDGWGMDLVYEPNGNTICGTGVGDEAFRVRSFGPNRITGASPGGLDDDIIRAQTVDSAKLTILKFGTECS